MKLNHYLYLLLSFVLLSNTSWAQQTLDLGKNNYDDKKGIVYLQENTFEFTFHTNGAALGLNFGKIETYYKTRYWHIGIGELKHFRETRQNRTLQGGGGLGGNFRSYIFGKQNNFYVIRGGFGEKRYFSQKAKSKGVAVGFTYQAGPSLGLLKPYYLIMRFASENTGLVNNFRSERYSAENESRFLTNSLILGADSFTRGLTEVNIRPGGHAKAALHFDWGAFDEFVKTVELGIMADFYFAEVPILVESDITPGIQNRALFLNLFVNVQFGKRK